MRQRLLISVRSILLGWAMLFGITYMVERPLLLLSVRFLGPSWLATVELALTCAGLAATGWMVGRWNRFDAMAAAVIFAIMLAFWNFGLVPVNLPWMLRLILDAFQDLRYLESLLTALATHVFLFGSLLAGARLSSPAQPPMSIAPARMDNRA